VLDSANDATRGDLGQSIAAGSGCTQRRSSPHEDDTFMGWFALTSREADALPRAMYARRRPGGGFYYLYRADAFDRAATVVAARDGMWAEWLDRRRSWAKAGELN
jgi:hypothetical protein